MLSLSLIAFESGVSQQWVKSGPRLSGFFAGEGGLYCSACWVFKLWKNCFLQAARPDTKTMSKRLLVLHWPYDVYECDLDHLLGLGIQRCELQLS